MGKLDGKVAIVTGASSGVGRGIAKMFALAGAKVCACARSVDKLEELVAEVKELGGDMIAVGCDVMNPLQIKNVVSKCVEQYKKIDILANMAQGAMKPMPLDQIDEDYALLAYKSGPLASMYFMQECLPYLKESGQGRIINTASAAGYDGNDNYIAYGMAKEAIRALTRGAANEWGKYGITANVFLPIITTEHFRKNEPEALAYMESLTPLHRIGTTEDDCAPLLILLASDEGSYLTGQSYMIDGGIHKHS